jgi:hypothetical protein
MTLLCIKLTVARSKEVKTGCSLAESSKKGRSSKRGCFATGVDGDGYSDMKKCIKKLIPKA